MAIPKIMTGARAKVYVDDQLIGVFDSINYTVEHGTEVPFILGRMSGVEVTTVSYEPVRVNCSGWRAIGDGPGVKPKFPKLQDLLTVDTAVTITVLDRQASASASPIATIKGCVPTTKAIGYQAKTNSKIQISYTGLVEEDESGAQAEPTDASNI